MDKSLCVCLCVSVRLVSVCLQFDTRAAKTNSGILFVWKFGFWPGEVMEKSWNFFLRFLWEPCYNIWWGGDYNVTLYFHSWQYLVRGWLYRDFIFSLRQYFMRGWLYRDLTFSLLTIFDEGVIITWPYIFTLDNIWWGGDYIVTLYFHSRQYFMRGWLYGDLIFSLLTIFGEGVIILWPYIFTPDNIWWGGDYIVTLYFHSWQYLVRGWLYRALYFHSWQYWWGDDYIVTLYFHSWQYLVRGWLYHDFIFSLLTIFGEGVIISWPYIFTPDNIWWGGDYIVTLYFHSWQYSVRGWLYRDIFTPDNIWWGGDHYIMTFSLLTIFGEGVIILWPYIFTLDNIWWGGDYIMTLYFHSWQCLGRGWLYRDIFTHDNIWWGGDIVTLYFHSWQYLVRGWLYRELIFSLLKMFGEGVIISWHFHSWQYLVRGWIYRDIIFSLLAIFGEGVIISWPYIFTPDNVWWGGDYIVTFSLLTICGEGVIISWHYIFTPDAPLESVTRGDNILIFSLYKFDYAVIPGFYYSYTYIQPMKFGGSSDYI